MGVGVNSTPRPLYPRERDPVPLYRRLVVVAAGEGGDCSKINARSLYTGVCISETSVIFFLDCVVFKEGNETHDLRTILLLYSSQTQFSLFSVHYENVCFSIRGVDPFASVMAA
jgi:hypothetical protein